MGGGGWPQEEGRGRSMSQTHHKTQRVGVTLHPL